MPPEVELDAYNSEGWIGVIPFRMAGIRLNGLPPLPWFSAFPELNIRTYVTVEKKPGVFFFSLDAANSVAVAVAVAVAQRWYHLSYFYARMSSRRIDDAIYYSSRRVHRNATPTKFKAQYHSTGDVFRSCPGTLEHWLTKHYCLYAVDAYQCLYRREIHHLPWPLHSAQVEIHTNTMTVPFSLCLIHNLYSISRPFRAAARSRCMDCAAS